MSVQRVRSGGEASVEVVGSMQNHQKATASAPGRKILGPWEPRDLCIKRFDAQGQGVGLVSYILAYSDDDKPLSEVDALLKQEGWTLFEDATPTEQAVYVQQRMKARAVQAVEVRGEDHR